MKTKADIVFCIDKTASMDPCIEGVKNGIATLVKALNTAAEVDARFRLIAYSDIHDPEDGTPWDILPFTESAELFASQVAQVEAIGRGDAPESTLDALYIALKSDWRTTDTHKTVVLLTDADTHPTLHSTTFDRPGNDVYRVIQDLHELRHAMLFIVAPKCEAYIAIEADRKSVV